MGLRKEKNSVRIGQALQDGLQAFSVYIPLIAIVIIATSIRSRWTAPRKHSQAAEGAHTRPAWQTACSRRPGSVNFRVIYLLLHACLGALWSSSRKCPADLHHNRIGSCQASTFACECQAISGRAPGEMRLDPSQQSRRCALRCVSRKRTVFTRRLSGPPRHTLLKYNSAFKRGARWNLSSKK